MSVFDDAVTEAMTHWFGGDLADQPLLNGEQTACHLVESGTDEDHRTQYDYWDVEFPNAVAAGLDYKTAVLTVDGIDWKRPVKQRGDGLTTVLRWRRNERHLPRV